jgi:hypothetical protein
MCDQVDYRLPEFSPGDLSWSHAKLDRFVVTIEDKAS